MAAIRIVLLMALLCGMLLSAARAEQAAFELKAFHEEFLSYGLIPIALARYLMTGLDDEIEHFWEQRALP